MIRRSRRCACSWSRVRCSSVVPGKGSVEVKIRGSIALLALALMLPASGIAQPPAHNDAKAPAPGGPRPVIQLPSMAFNFGEIYHQDSYVHAFTVKNVGNADLTIEDVKPG